MVLRVSKGLNPVCVKCSSIEIQARFGTGDLAVAHPAALLSVEAFRTPEAFLRKRISSVANAQGRMQLILTVVGSPLDDGRNY